MTSISSVAPIPGTNIQPTGNATVDQLITASQATIAASRAAFPTGGIVRGTNDIITPSAHDLAKQAAAQAAADRATAAGSIGFAPSSFASQLAKLSIDQMLIQDFMAVNGMGTASPANKLSFTPDPLRGGFDLFL